MSRYIFIDTHQIDAVKSAITRLENALKRKHKRYQDALREYQGAQEAKREADNPTVGWWNTVGRPATPNDSEEAAELERLRAIVVDFEAQQ